MQARRRRIIAACMLACSAAALAQPPQRMIPRILKGPADWRFEGMPTPPMFAPDIQFTGFEEARFAPGMFDTSSPNYFTYVLIISADGSPNLDRAAVKDFLEKYYRGLSAGVGRQKGLSPDRAQMVAEVAPASDPNRLNGKVIFFDTFNDGRKITLNFEGRIVPRPDAKKTGLVLLISPQPKDNGVWKTLREIDSTIDFGGG